MPEIRVQSIRVPVSDEDIVNANEMRRGLSLAFGVPYSPAFSDEQVAAAQARIAARQQQEHEAWLALPRRTRFARRARIQLSRIGHRVERIRERVALRIAPWLASED